MPPLKLGIHQLAASEAIVVRTLMWLYGGRDGCNWVFADAPPYDAVLMFKILVLQSLYNLSDEPGLFSSPHVTRYDSMLSRLRAFT